MVWVGERNFFYSCACACACACACLNGLVRMRQFDGPREDAWVRKRKKKKERFFNYQIYDDHHKSSFMPRPSTFRSTDNISVKFSFNKTKDRPTLCVRFTFVTLREMMKHSKIFTNSNLKDERLL